WPSGKVYGVDGEGPWQDMGRLGSELEVMGMVVHNGQLYAGTLPRGEVYRFGGGRAWTALDQLDATPKVRYRRVWTMAQYRGKLFCATLPFCHIYSLETGPNVTLDHAPLPGGHCISP